MGQLQFITDVPFTQGFDNRQRRDDEHALNQMRLNTSDWALNESMRKSGEAQGQDIALGRAVQGSLPAVPAQAPAPIPAMPAIPPVPAGIDPAAHAQLQQSAASEAAQSQAVPAQASPLAAASTSRGFRTNVSRQLAMAPGGGAAAAQHLQGAMESEEAKEEKFLEIATKNPDMAVQYATMNGLKVDENMLGLIRNRKAMASISGLLDASKAIYPGEQNAAVRAKYLQQQFGRLNEMAKGTQGVSQADVMGGYVSPDMPTPVVKPQWAPQLTNVQGQDGKPGTAIFDPNTGTISETPYKSVDRYGRGVQSGQTERIAANIREEDPSLSYAESIALAQKAPTTSADQLARERIALQAAKNEFSFRTNPIRTLEKWRKHYGLTDEAPDYGGVRPPSPTVPPASGAASQKPAGSKYKSAAPTQPAIDYLRANPGFAPQFDEKYGKGASQKYIRAQ